MKPVFGIIGCGSISRFHFEGLRKAGAEIIHISDLNKAAALPYVNEFKSRYSADYRDLIKDPDVTVVSVLTNAKSHHRICLEALEAGKDVICEKTLANNSKESLEIVNAVKKSGRLFYTAYMKRFFPAYIKALEIIQSLGTLFSAQVRTYQPWGDFYQTDKLGDWDFVVPNYGGAILKCAGSHMLDMIMGLTGKPDRVYGHIDYVDGTLFDRKVVALLEFSSGMTVQFEAATHPLKKIGYERNAWDEFIEINGTEGRIRLSTVLWDQPMNNPAILEHYDNRMETSTEYRFDRVNPFDTEMAEIVHSLEKRIQIRPDVMDGYNVDALIESISKSHQSKKSISINWEQP